VWSIKYTARSLDFIDDLKSIMLATLQVCLISFVSPFRTLSKLFFLLTAAIKTLAHPSDTIVQTLTYFILVLNIAEMQFMLLIIYSNVSEEYSSFSYINDQRTNYFLSKRFLSVTRKTEKDRIRNVCFERITKDRSCYSIADRGFRA
jgi:hypothetical protein